MPALSSIGGPQYLEALHAWGVLKSLPETALDELASLAARACEAPFVLISLLDSDREWFKSRLGLALDALPREAAISGPAVLSGELVVIPDALTDVRLQSHSLVVSEPHIRFYASVPFSTNGGHSLGALTVMDRMPRDLSMIQREALQSLSRQVTALLEVKRSVASLRRELVERERAQYALTTGETDFRLLAESLPQIVWVRRYDGTLYFINRRGLEYTGLSFAQMTLQRSPADSVHPDDRHAVEKVWSEALASGDAFGIEARLRRHDGVYRWYLIRAHAIRDSQGRVVKWMGTSTDVHDVKESNERNAFLLDLSTELASIKHPQELVCAAMSRLNERLQATKVTLAEIENDADDAVVLTECGRRDAPLEIMTISAESFRHLAVEASQGLTTVLCDTRTDNRSAHVYETWYRPRGARALIAVPLLRGGNLVALLSVVNATPRDWTTSEMELVKRVADIVWPAFEKARADRELAMSEERLRLSQAIARIGAWEWDPASNHCFFSPEGYDLFGLDPGKRHELDAMLARVDTRDSATVQSAFGSCTEQGTVEFEYRYRHPSRGMRWLHVKAGSAFRAGRICVVGIGLDITERKQAEEALREVNQRKDEFLAMLAHELRNPLAPIRNAAQILRVHAKSNPQLDWARSVIERQARHLTRLVDDLLDVSRIVRGQIVLERSVVDLAETIQHALETSRPLIRERRHQLEVLLPQQPVRLEGDLTRLSQVLANLLINAAKYTSEGGQICLEATVEGAQVLVRVRDTGIGIPPRLLPHIFDLFTQGERTLDRSQGGLGIGLTLVKRIVEMHGGSVQALSTGQDRGSEFIVRLPVIQWETHPVEVESRVDESMPTSQLRILVVDDNVDAAESIAMLLSLDGHEVRSVHDAQDALDAAVEFHPDVVLLDIGLPGMDGYEVARRLRTRREIMGTRLVAVTGYGQQEDRERAQAAGFDQHLVKPVEPDALNAVLGSVQAAKH